MLHLDYRDVRPLYAQITDKIRQQISGGVLVQGDKLPSVRELAVELSINPNTIQRAYAQLEAEGFVYSVAGRGSFVAEDGEQNSWKWRAGSPPCPARAASSAGVLRTTPSRS